MNLLLIQLVTTGTLILIGVSVLKSRSNGVLTTLSFGNTTTPSTFGAWVFLKGTRIKSSDMKQKSHVFSTGESRKYLRQRIPKAKRPTKRGALNQAKSKAGDDLIDFQDGKRRIQGSTRNFHVRVGYYVLVVGAALRYLFPYILLISGAIWVMRLFLWLFFA